MEPGTNEMTFNTHHDRTDFETIDDPSRVAYYIRRSTFKQENEHQVMSIAEYLGDQGYGLGDAHEYEETASGARRDREQLRDLMAAVEDDQIDHVIVWELSRIARDGLLAQEFFTLCEEHDVAIHVTDGNVRLLTPDGRNRFAADIYASIYADERRTLIRRTKMGQRRALENDKWVGQPPLGFTTDADGFLIPNIEVYGDDFNPDRDGYFAVEEAIRRIHEEDASYRGLAESMICSRRALSNIYNDEERRPWYIERESTDNRVNSALEELDRMENGT